METIIKCCFAAGVDVAMLENEEKAGKRRRTVLELYEFSNIVLVEIGHFCCFDLRPE